MISLLKLSRARLSLLSSLAIVGVMALAACQASAPQPTATTAAATGTPVPTLAATDTQAAATPTTAAATATTAAATATPAAAATATGAVTGTPAAATPTAGTSPTPMTTTTIKTSSAANLGTFLVDNNGMTLYIFKKDTPGVSACSGSCVTLWPPLAAANGAAPQAGTGVSGTLGTITRADGIVQVTYNNQPLYYFSGDKAAGDTKGQGIGNVWYVIAP